MEPHPLDLLFRQQQQSGRKPSATFRFRSVGQWPQVFLALGWLFAERNSKLRRLHRYRRDRSFKLLRDFFDVELLLRQALQYPDVSGGPRAHYFALCRHSRSPRKHECSSTTQARDTGSLDSQMSSIDSDQGQRHQRPATPSVWIRLDCRENGQHPSTNIRRTDQPPHATDNASSIRGTRVLRSAVVQDDN